MGKKSIFVFLPCAVPGAEQGPPLTGTGLFVAAAAEPLIYTEAERCRIRNQHSPSSPGRKSLCQTTTCSIRFCLQQDSWTFLYSLSSRVLVQVNTATWRSPTEKARRENLLRQVFSKTNKMTGRHFIGRRCKLPTGRTCPSGPATTRGSWTSPTLSQTRTTGSSRPAMYFSSASSTPSVSAYPSTPSRTAATRTPPSC